MARPQAAPDPTGSRRALDLAVRLLALGVLLAVPLRVLARGYLPPDDALRHAAKAVSGRPWSEIVRLRPEFTADPHAGWHAILGALHTRGGLSIEELVSFSVAMLFFSFSLGPVLLLRRAEAWLVALLLLGIAEPFFIDRWLLGRPLLLTAAVVPLVLLLAPRLDGERPRATLAVIAGAAALATWIHGSFYLLALPLLALFGARRWRSALRATAAVAAGVVAGALLTGHPAAHLYQALRHAYVSAAGAMPAAWLVTELQPFDGKPAVVAGFLALLAWRAHRRGLAGLTREPAVVMVVMSWTFGYVAHRFWIDWGAPALLTFAALEIEDALESSALRLHRLAMTAGAGAVLLLQTGADMQGRWTDQSERPYLSRSEPDHAPWLPDPGGTVYSAEMSVFYSVFFKNPHAPWTYAIGFEPALAPPEDYET